MLLACQHCLQLNRIADDRINDSPVCGKCKKALFSAYVSELNSHNFNALVERSDIPVVVDFWASSCGSCMNFAPTFAQAAHEFEPTFRFAKVNTEIEAALAQRFAIRSIPTLMIFEEGKLLAQQSGALPKSAFYQWLKTHGNG